MYILVIVKIPTNTSIMNWLAIWGVTQAVGFIFKPIFEELAKDIAKN